MMSNLEKNPPEAEPKKAGALNLVFQDGIIEEVKPLQDGFDVLSFVITREDAPQIQFHCRLKQAIADWNDIGKLEVGKRIIFFGKHYHKKPQGYYWVVHGVIYYGD
jgi:hypothetical protein